MNFSYKFWVIGVVAIGAVAATLLFLVTFFGQSEVNDLALVTVVPSPVPTAVVEFDSSRPSASSAPRQNEYRDISSALAAQTNPEQLILYEEEITDDLGELVTLKQLVIRSDTLTSLPASIGKLQRLEILNVANTPQLASLPAEIGDLVSLEQLDIANTAITVLPAEIKGLKRLRVVFASVSQLSDSEKNRIKQILPNVNILER